MAIHKVYNSSKNFTFHTTYFNTEKSVSAIKLVTNEWHRFEHSQSGFTDEFIKIVSHLNEKCKQKSKFEGVFSLMVK